MVCMVAAWWLHGGCMVAAWWLHGGCMVAAWWLHDGCMAWCIMHQASDIRHQTSDIMHHASGIRHHIRNTYFCSGVLFFTTPLQGRSYM
jgi:hypothetical protein